jgi:hypothetical protein
MEDKLNVGLYARVSSQRQAEELTQQHKKQHKTRNILCGGWTPRDDAVCLGRLPPIIQRRWCELPYSHGCRRKLMRCRVNHAAAVEEKP